MKRREQCFRSLTFIFFVFFMVWVLLQFIAPVLLPTGSVSDLSGLVAVSDNEQTIQNMSFPWNLMYQAGDRLCHQKADRSLFINENEMPFCTRCTAIWLGLAIGLGFMVLYSIELNEKVILAILVGLIPLGVDGVGQLFGFWESTNLIRFITGFFAGCICGVALGVILDEIKMIRFARNSKK